MKRQFRLALPAIVVLLIATNVFFPFNQVLGQSEPPYYFPFFLNDGDPNYAFGLDGGTVVNIILDPINPDTLYAGTWGNGIYKSTNAGETWTHIVEGLRSPYIYEIAIDPSDPQHLLASVYTHGIDQSFDGGETWEETTGFPPYAVSYSIDFDPVNPQYVYTAIRTATQGSVYPGGVWKSTDGGSSWVEKSSGIVEDYIYDLAIDPNDPNVIYTANHRTGVYKTANAGISWTKMSSGLVHQDIRGIQVNRETGRVYAGLWDGYGFAYSDNGGESWVNNSWSNSKDLYVFEIQYDPEQPNNVYITTSTGVYVCPSPSAGSTCTGIANIGEFVWDLALDDHGAPASNGRTMIMYTGVQHFGLHKSVDGGDNFDPSYQGIRANIVRAIAIDPINPDNQYVSASYRGLFKSSDAGNTWKSLHYALDLKHINDIAINPDNPDMVYVGDKFGGIYYSLDGGESWQPGNTGIARSVSPDEDEIEVDVPEGWIDEDDYEWMDPVDLQDLMDAVGTNSTDRETIVPITTINFDPIDSKMMFAGTNGGGVKCSNNAGINWYSSNLKSGLIKDSLVDPISSNKFLIGIADYGFKVSSDRINWVDLNSGLPADIDVNALALQDTGVYIAGTGDGVYRLNKSEGGIWVKLGLDFDILIRDVVLDPTNSEMIWVTTYDGLYYGLPTGEDGGYKWIKFDLKGSNNENMKVIEVIPGATREFYIGMDGGDIYPLTEDLPH